MDAIYNNRWYSGFSLAALFALLVGCVVSCQGSATPSSIEVAPVANQEQPSVDAEQEPAPMPSPLEALRKASNVGAGPLLYGSQNDPGLAHNNFISESVFGLYKPVLEGDGSIGDSAFAVYHFDLSTYEGEHSFETSWGIGFNNWENLWFGLSNWDLNIWDWKQPELGNLTDPQAISNYVNAEGQLLVVVLLNKGDSGRLHWLHPGIFPQPELSLEANTYIFLDGIGSKDAPYLAQASHLEADLQFEVTDGPGGSGEPVDPASLSWKVWAGGIGDPIYEWVEPGSLAMLSEETSLCAVYCYDDKGNYSNLVYLLQDTLPGYEFVVCFKANQTSGDYPLQVDFERYQCYVTVPYSYYELEWDYDSDGVVDQVVAYYSDIGMEDPSFVYHQPGTYHPIVSSTLFDSVGDFTDTFSRTITVTDSGGSQWHFNQLPTPPGITFAEASLVRVLDIGGRPAIFAVMNTGDNERSTAFFLATDEFGEDWEDPVIVATSDVLYSSSSTLISGIPTLAYSTQSGLFLVQADDPLGRSWEEVQHVWIPPSGRIVSLSLADISGSPGLAVQTAELNDYRAYFLGYDGVTEPNGWFDVLLDSPEYPYDGKSISLSEVQGHPAVAYTYSREDWEQNDELRFRRALNPLGTEFGDAVIINEAPGNSCREPSLRILNGIPTVSFFNPENLQFSVADTPNGASWEPTVTVGSIDEYFRYSGWFDEFQGKPVIFSREARGGNRGITMRLSSDSSGSEWNDPTTVYSSAYYGADAAVVAGKPVVVMTRVLWYEEPESRVNKVFIGMYY